MKLLFQQAEGFYHKTGKFNCCSVFLWFGENRGKYVRTTPNIFITRRANQKHELRKHVFTAYFLRCFKRQPRPHIWERKAFFAQCSLNCLVTKKRSKVYIKLVQCFRIILRTCMHNKRNLAALLKRNCVFRFCLWLENYRANSPFIKFTGNGPFSWIPHHKTAFFVFISLPTFGYSRRTPVRFFFGVR